MTARYKNLDILQGAQCPEKILNLWAGSAYSLARVQNVEASLQAIRRLKRGMFKRNSGNRRNFSVLLKIPIFAIDLAAPPLLCRKEERGVFYFALYTLHFSTPMGDPMLRLLELDERHNELLNRLSELDRQVVVVLEEWTRAKEFVGNEESNVDGDRRCPAA